MSALGGTPAQPEPAPDFGASAAETPDWMSSIGGTPTQPEPDFVAPATETPDWMSGFGGTPTQPEPAPDFGAPAADSGMPDWMSGIGASEVPSFEAPAAPLAASETPDWLASMGVAAPAEPEPAFGVAEPDWMSGLGGTESASPAISPFGDIPAEAASADMPDWLASMKPGEVNISSAPVEAHPFGAAGAFGEEPAPEMDPAMPAMAAGLAAGELPTWMKSMRPTDTPLSQVAPEVDNYQEKLGILAGMRGVLQAEPTIAQPRRSATEAQKLLVDESEASQATLIATILQEESEETRPASKRKLQISLPVERWLVFAVLAVAVIVPWFFMVGFFPVPTTIGRETEATFTQINQLANAKPVLVAFDYDPAQRGELDPAASALVGHLMRRGVTIVSMSTLPAGAGIAQDLLGRLTADLKNQYGVSYTYGTNYINLGYLPGGPVGLALFAANPRAVFANDFTGGLNVWDAVSAPGMFTINRFSDFGALVLLSTSPESARVWIEQLQSQAADMPVFMAVSAGAEPLVRPYYESGQIKGLLTGLISTAQYEQRAGVPGAATERWDALGGGLLAAVVLLVMGNLVSGVLSLLRNRKR